MKNLTDTGPKGATVFYTSALPAGFYVLGFKTVTASGTGADVKKNGTTFFSLNGYPEQGWTLYLEPGDQLSYVLPVSGAWEMNFFLYAAAELAL